MAEVEAPQIDTGIKKKFMFVNRKAPYGTIYALEALEVVLISAAFEQDVSLAFLDDGVYQLVKGQNTSGIGMKNFSPTYRALGDYEITKLFVERESLDERGLKPEDLMEITYEDEGEDFAEKPSIRVVSRSELTEIMARQDVLMNF
jgi:tRNA 2-thiouridine synthesizing protein C